MSKSVSVVPVEPKRERGRIRVAAIMEAGIEVFLDKGFDAATMTEIAARSGTAIGSLYRFFPSKESLADALLLEYTQKALHELGELEKHAADLKPDGVADALVDLMLSLHATRALAITLVERRTAHENRRTEFREAMRVGIARILRNALPSLPVATAKIVAIVVLHVLKGVASAQQEKAAVRQVLLVEIRRLLQIYLSSMGDT